jgi:hypothetical protein
LNSLNSMADIEPGDELPVIDTQSVPCRHLRNKGMYVYTDGTSDETAEDFDSTVYWCLQTMKNFGPDDDMVGGRECRDTARSCYEPF